MRQPVAIVDIGSNSVRLVVFAAIDRPRDKIVNEKVMAGLGRLDSKDRLPAQGLALALAALKHFRAIADEMDIDTVHAFATAAVRDASDGEAFLREVRKLGFEAVLVPGHAEAQLAARGVLVGHPDADGLVADLGGGSLDLAWLRKGEAGPGVSLDLGVLRIGKGDEAIARKAIHRALAGKDTGDWSSGRTLLLVGGSFRTLARIDRALDGRDSDDIKGYRMTSERAEAIRSALRNNQRRVAQIVEDPRLGTSPIAAMLLDVLVDEIGASDIVVSGCGVREGFLQLLGDPLAFQRVLR